MNVKFHQIFGSIGSTQKHPDKVFRCVFCDAVVSMWMAKMTVFLMILARSHTHWKPSAICSSKNLSCLGKKTSWSSWWFSTNPFEKKQLVRMDHFWQGSGSGWKSKKYLSCHHLEKVQLTFQTFPNTPYLDHTSSTPRMCVVLGELLDRGMICGSGRLVEETPAGSSQVNKQVIETYIYI